jgi:hypothetical protein
LLNAKRDNKENNFDTIETSNFLKIVVVEFFFFIIFLSTTEHPANRKISSSQNEKPLALEHKHIIIDGIRNISKIQQSETNTKEIAVSVNKEYISLINNAHTELQKH